MYASLGKPDRTLHRFTHAPSHAGEFRYDKLFEKFVFKEYPRLFDNWNQFENVKATKNSLQKLKIYPEFLVMLQTKGNFLEKSLKNTLVAKANYEIVNVFNTIFQRTLPDFLYTVMICEFLKFTMPLGTEQIAADPDYTNVFKDPPQRGGRGLGKESRYAISARAEKMMTKKF